uniref:Uncharacterized protein n=1 Tax=Rhizophora mucronata TaxID=61149 RepID=A0A2P2PV54_RHIMU
MHSGPSKGQQFKQNQCPFSCR